MAITARNPRKARLTETSSALFLPAAILEIGGVWLVWQGSA